MGNVFGYKRLVVIGLWWYSLWFLVSGLAVYSFPLIPREALNRDTAFILGCIAGARGTFGIWIYYIWQTFEVVRGASPLLASAWKTPVIVLG